MIYNSTSTNSIVVKNYYLAHRPLVGGANVLGFSSPTNEQIDLATFTNQIIPPVLLWFTNNPTKHPQYLILFPDIPSTVTNTAGVARNSVAYGLSTNVWGVEPFVTSINMGLFDATNDCIHYIDKVKNFGTNGQVVISASVGAYPNVNYEVDNVRNSDYGIFGSYGNITNALQASGVATSSIYYMDAVEPCSGYGTNIVGGETNVYCNQWTPLPHIATGTNVAAYLCWGNHSTLSSTYATNRAVSWSGASGWWIMESFESYNGLRENDSSLQAFFLQFLPKPLLSPDQSYTER